MKLRNTLLSLICFLCLLCSGFASKHVIETTDMAHVLDYVSEGTLVVFDLDNTLIETSQHLGSDEWFSHRLKHLLTKGHNIDEALRMVMPHYVAIQKKTSVRYVDPAIPQILHKMHQPGVQLIALTKRDPELAERTLEQLASLHIDFSATSEISGSILFPDHHNSIYRNGIIFVAQQEEKGPVFKAFLSNIDTLPKQIILIDDKMAHIQSVATALESLHIPFIGVRYGGADQKVSGFDPQIADIQWEYFEKILSDEEARLLIALKHCKSGC